MLNKDNSASNNSNSVARRKRSVVLDRARVRARCNEVGIRNHTQLQLKYIKDYCNDNPDASTDTPDKAWHGKKLSITRAELIANILELNGDYTQLLEPETPEWLQLLKKDNKSSNTIKIEQTNARLGLIDFGWDDSEELPEYPNGSFWKLKVNCGFEKPELFALLCTDTAFVQIAPVDEPDFEFSKTDGELLYPAKKALRFDDRFSSGPRTLIVITGEDLGVVALGRGQNFEKSQNELDVIAHKILNSGKPYSISTLRIRLV